MLQRAQVRPAGTAVAEVRGQSPGRRRFGWPRSRGTTAESSLVNIPRVSLGEPAAPPAAPGDVTLAVPRPPAGPAASPPQGDPAATQAATHGPGPAQMGQAAATPPPFPPVPPTAAPINSTFNGAVPARMSSAGSTRAAPPLAVLPTASSPSATSAATSRTAVPPPQPAAPPASTAGSDAGMIQRLTSATVRIKVQDHNGHSFGSGTIIEFQPARQGPGGEALVLTCGHIFRDSAGKGLIQVDLFDGSGQRDLVGSLVRYDLARDIGLLKFNMPHQAQPAELATPNDQPVRGHRVVSIGCDQGKPPTVHRSHVMAVNSFVGPPNLQVSGQPAIGRSGGGLFNDRGQLIGVCNFADPTDRAGLYAAVKVAREVIAQSGLVLRSRGPSPAGAATSLAGIPSSRIDIGLPAGTLPTTGSPPAARKLSPTEVICIVRTNDGTNTQRQVIVIENASSDLISQLASEQQKQQRTFPTTMDSQPSRPIRSLPQRPMPRNATMWQPQWK